MSSKITERVERLRDYMQQNGLSAFIFPSTDPHCGEYVPAHWMTRQWISGFDGSAGTAVVTLSDAALWTDSRYFIAAENQLQGTPFRLMKDGLPETPSITKWLCQTIHNSQPKSHISPREATEKPVVGLDGNVNTIADIQAMKEELGKAGIQIRTDLDPAETLWTERPAIPQDKVEIQPLEFAGETAESKIERVRQALKEQYADGMVINQLDEIAWLLNLRGTDVHCNPLFVSYVLLTTDEVTLFIDKEKLNDTTSAYLEGIGVETRPYEAPLLSTLKGREDRTRIIIDPDTANYNLIQDNPAMFMFHASPIPAMRAVKNAAEIAGYRRAMLRDGVAMVKFLRWLKPAVEAGGETEISIDRKLTALRAEQPHYRGLSFDTIAAYGTHGAIVHYEATPETDIPLEPRGFLLLDSGAQYQDGTTDITRTIPLGPLTDEERMDYTLVLKGHIRLALTRFPDGISGTRIDALARYAMWQHGINYGHGTGHGVGSYLCVHEGPHQIRHTWKPAPLHAGMTVTNEPGIYRAGKHGVRIENTMLIVEDGETEFGKFLRLEPLTLCPIDLTPVEWEMMTTEEVDYVKRYNEKVYEQLSPMLDEEEREWLKSQIRKKA